jgi:hypothetical protein
MVFITNRNIFIEKHHVLEVIQYESKSSGTIRLPIILDEVWNQYNELSFPPEFNTFTDGSIGTDGLTKIYLRRQLTI